MEMIYSDVPIKIYIASTQFKLKDLQRPFRYNGSWIKIDN